MTYAIYWRSRLTGATGNGQPVFPDKNVAQRWADDLNAEWPDFEHWVSRGLPLDAPWPEEGCLVTGP